MHKLFAAAISADVGFGSIADIPGTVDKEKARRTAMRNFINTASQLPLITEKHTFLVASELLMNILENTFTNTNLTKEIQ